MTMPTETVSGGALRRDDPTWRLPVILRRVLLLGPPLLLAGLEIVHPQPEASVQGLLDVATWFAVFHVIQLALTGLVALSVLLLAAGLGRATAWATRLGVGAFLVFFSAYDTLAGIGTGLAMQSARDLSTTQQEGVFEVVKDWPGLSPCSHSASSGPVAGWSRSAPSHSPPAGWAAPRREWIPLGLAAVFLLGGHPFPAGTLAFGSFFIAALLHEWSSGRSPGLPRAHHTSGT